MNTKVRRGGRGRGARAEIPLQTLERLRWSQYFPAGHREETTVEEIAFFLKLWAHGGAGLSIGTEIAALANNPRWSRRKLLPFPKATQWVVRNGAQSEKKAG